MLRGAAAALAEVRARRHDPVLAWPQDGGQLPSPALHPRLDRLARQPDEPLGYGRTYTLSATGQGSGAIDAVLPARDLVVRLAEEYEAAREQLCGGGTR